MEETIKELEQLQKEIDEAKEEKARIEGQLSVLMETLRNNFNCRTLEAAERKIKQLKSKAEKSRGKVETGLAALKEKYEW